MKLTGKIAALAATMSIIGAAAYAEGPGDKRPMKELTRAEAIQHAGERFDKADTNGDGVLSHEEMRAGAKNMREHGKRSQDRRQDDRGDKIFDKTDTDGNGALSIEEFSVLHEKMTQHRNGGPQHSAQDVFEHLDADADGSVTKDEMSKAKRPGKGPRGGDKK